MYLIRTQCNSASTNWSLLLLLLSSFSHVWLCATPEMAAHQALPSLGFSRQEHWSHFPLQCMKVKSESEVTQSPVRLFATPWTAAHQAPPPMGFSRQEYWSGVPLPSPNWSLVLCKSNQLGSVWNLEEIQKKNKIYIFPAHTIKLERQNKFQEDHVPG